MRILHTKTPSHQKMFDGNYWPRAGRVQIVKPHVAQILGLVSLFECVYVFGWSVISSNVSSLYKS